MNMQIRSHHAVDVVKAAGLWHNGLSAAQIAARFDVSRNVIIGLAYRQRHLFPERKARVNSLKTKAKRVPKKPELDRELLRPEATDVKPTDYDNARKTLAKGLIELAADECRFPLDNGRPCMFCAAGVREKSAYCSHHHFRVYRRKESA